MADEQEDAKTVTGKSKVIEHLFRERYDPSTGQISDPIIMSDALVKAIEHCNSLGGKELSTFNPANFLKDFLRSPNRNDLWPAALKQARITARQKYRKKRVFAFAPYAEDQTKPFPDIFVLPEEAEEHVVESVSLPSAARALGRKDEAWLIQTCVHQRIVQTQFAIHSHLSPQSVDLFHLQNSVKTTPEIDAIFLMTLRRARAGEVVKALVTLEAKRDEPILADQIRAQVALMAKQCREKPALRDVSLIVPVAARSQRHNGARVIGLFEMAPIAVDEGADAYHADEEHLLKLEIVSAVPYRLRPDVPGI
jgi:hypothetical protein